MGFIKKYLSYIQWAAAVIAVFLAMFSAYSYRGALADQEIAELRLHYQSELSKAHAARAAAITKQQEITNDVEARYLRDVEQLRGRVRELASGIRAMPPIPRSTAGTHAAPSQSVLAEPLAECRDNRLRLIEDGAEDALTILQWQRWYDEQRKAWKN